LQVLPFLYFFFKQNTLGADFIKTSTGKEAVNATLESAAIMCHAIKHYYKLTGRKVGFKPAGGIRTVEEAHSYRSLVMKILGPEWANSSSYFRIGASRGLLENIRDKLNSL
jgi:deoxyribose-phosphate aldolase